MVMFGGQYVGIAPLTQFEHLICLATGAASLVVGFVIKLLPNCLFNRLSLFREEQMQNMDNSLTSRMRRKSSVRLGTVSTNTALER